MKVIDIFHKIVNGEEVPKKIKFNKIIYEYQEESYDYLRYNIKILEKETTMWFFNELFSSIDNTLDILNFEVEIIEDNKEDNKKIKKIGNCNTKMNKYQLFYELADKINEIIDRLNEGDK